MRPAAAAGLGSARNGLSVEAMATHTLTVWRRLAALQRQILAAALRVPRLPTEG